MSQENENLYEYKNDYANREVNNYFKDLSNPPLNRNGTKYYIEMQLLAFQLLRYLKMNDDPNEHQFQGNYNWTYFKESMSEEDYQYLANKVTGSLNGEGWKEVINYWKIDDEREDDILEMIEEKERSAFASITYEHSDCKIPITVAVDKKDTQDMISKLNKQYTITSLRVV